MPRKNRRPGQLEPRDYSRGVRVSRAEVLLQRVEPHNGTETPADVEKR